MVTPESSNLSLRLKFPLARQDMKHFPNARVKFLFQGDFNHIST